MATAIGFRFSGTTDDLKKTLDYLELQADGAYYINNVSITPHVETKVVEGSDVVSVSTAAKDAKYDYNISMSLYYFEKVEIVEPSSSVAASK